MADPKAIPENRKLPKKEQDLFRSIVKFYETKQYKKGLKAADTVLKKFPNHGETLAMRGLTLNCLDKKEEAYDFCRRGLRNDVRSHVCWHVFGLLHRSDRNYGEAIKCYLNALRIDADNMQILRDLSLLQVQMRDLAGFVETRRKLLQLKSANKQNWIAYAVGNCLVGNYSVAIKVIDSYVGTQDSRERSYEESELVLYKGLVMQKAGRLEEALAMLDAEKGFVVDGLAWRNKRAELLLRLGRHEEAREAYLSLVHEDTECYPSHLGLQCAVLRLDPLTCAAMLGSLTGCELPSGRLALAEGQKAELLALYDDLLREAPKSLTLQMVPLGFVTGQEFRARVDAYMRRQIARGLPSLGSSLMQLFRTTDVETGDRVVAKDGFDLRANAEFRAVCELVDAYIASLRAGKGFPPLCAGNSNAKGPNSNGAPNPEPPTSLLWAVFLRVQLLEAEGRLAEALAQVEECVSHTPTAIDMIQRKARLLKRSGDLAAAADLMNEARLLDLADRYINNKATKYLLRAGQVEQGQSTIALFAKHEGDPQYNLFDMQCMWYELELGACRLRLRRFGPALKAFTAVQKHFADFVEDQFDFHTYCIRKMTLRAYTDILRLEDEILGHDYHLRALRGAIACYLALLETKPEESQEEAEQDYSGMSKEQKKREKAKARKAAKKKEEEEGKAREEEKRRREEAAAHNPQDEEQDGKGGKKKRGPDKPQPVDDDPDGEKLAAKEPLSECARLVSELVRHGSRQIQTHTLAYDVAMRRGKALLALQALLRGRRLRPHDPEVFVRTVGFFAHAATRNVHPRVAEVISAEQPALLDGGSIESHVEAFVSKAAPWSLPHAVAAARGLCMLKGGEHRARASAMVRAAAKGQTRGVNVDNLAKAVEALREIAGEAEAASLRAEAAGLFPLAAVFKPPASDA